MKIKFINLSGHILTWYLDAVVDDYIILELPTCTLQATLRSRISLEMERGIEVSWGRI